MKKILRVLIAEDSEDDALLALYQLKKGGFNIDYQRIDSAEEMKAALEEKTWDIVLSDYNMPNFNGLEALKLLQKTGLDIPFIVISGTIGEETAVETMKAGAHDYIMKNNMARLLPAIERELRESKNRAERKLLEQKQKETEILRESEEKFKHLVSDMPVGVLLLGVQTEVLLSNAHALKLLGLTEEQILGKTSIDPEWNISYENGALCPGFTNLVAQAIANKRSIHGIVIGIYHPPANNRVWLLADIIPQINNDGSIKHVVCTFIDISKRKKAEEALKESEALYRSILLASPDDITITDLEGRIVALSPSALKMFGYDDEKELLGRSIIEFLLHSDIERATHNISLMHEGVRTGPGEYRAYKKDKSIINIETNAEFILDAEGKPNKIVIIIRDITQRKLTEEKLTKLTAAVEQSPVSVIITDKNGIIEYANPFCSRLTGLSNDEIIGQNPRILKSDVTPNEVYKQLWETISSGRIWRGELCNRKKDDNLYWEWVSISPITNTEGEITHYVGIKEDITKRKKTLTALKESEEKHRILFMNSPDAYFIIIDGIVTNCNYATEVMLRGDRTQIIGNSAELFIPQFQPDGRKSSEVLSEHINKALAYGIYTFECTNIRLDKTSFFAEVSMAPINIDSKQALFTTLRDITRRKEAEEALQESKQYLQKLNAEKDKFLSIIAHDLRSPFAGILGLMELLAEKLPNLTMNKIQEYISLVHDSAINIHRLLENLLDWAKVQRGLIPFTRELLPLLSIAEKSITSIREIAQQKGIEINTEIPEQLNVLADSNMLQTIIRNLVSNAIKFTRKGGKVTLSAKTNPDNDIEISIKDTGIGMNNTTINNLFRLDVKTNLPGTEGEPSSGLGLILCKEFIERHGGQIWIESKEGKGSTFFFTIPSGKM